MISKRLFRIYFKFNGKPSSKPAILVLVQNSDQITKMHQVQGIFEDVWGESRNSFKI